jgi:hypothetical protein
VRVGPGLMGDRLNTNILPEQSEQETNKYEIRQFKVATNKWIGQGSEIGFVFETPLK